MSANSSTDVILAVMPFSPIHWPSLGTGQLLTSLRRAGIQAQSFYFNLLFAERIGFDMYRLVHDEMTPQSIFADWFFSAAAFDEMRLEDDSFLEANVSHNRLFEKYARGYCGKSVEYFASRFMEIRRLSVEFCDACAREILTQSPRIVGAGTSFMQTCASLALLKRIKQLDPSVITVLGGANCEAEMGLIFLKRCPWIDYVVSGEGDLLFPQLCRRLLKQPDVPPEQKVSWEGLYSRNGDEEISKDWNLEPSVAIVSNLDDLPFPDFADYFEAVKRIAALRDYVPFLPLEASRGCWKGQNQPCAFCGLNGKRITYRVKTADRLLQEMDALSEQYHTQAFFMCDTVMNMKLFQSLLPELIARKSKYTLFFETVSRLTKAQVKLLSDSGVSWFQPGVESLHDSFLHLLNKGNSAIHNIALLKYASEYGVVTSWNILYGIPGEQDECYQEMAEWIPYITHLEPPNLVPIRFDRFSTFYRKSSDYHLNLRPARNYERVFPFSPQEVRQMAYFFEDYETVVQRTSCLDQKPGFSAFVKNLTQWKKVFYSSSRPQLLYRQEGSQTEVHDTRPLSSVQDHWLTEPELEVLKLCDEPVTLQNIIANRLDNKKDIESVIADLKEKKLILQINHFYLSLVHHPTDPALSHRSTYKEIFFTRRVEAKRSPARTSWQFFQRLRSSPENRNV